MGVNDAKPFADAYGEMVDKVGAASASDEKTKHLAYIVVFECLPIVFTAYDLGSLNSGIIISDRLI